MGAIAVRFDPGVVHPHAKPPLYDAYREATAGLEVEWTDNAQAVTHFRRAIEIEPEYFWPQLYLYLLYTGEQEYEKAAALLQIALGKREQYAPLERIHIDFM